MEQRRKIVIPTGVEAEGELPTPHFDTEATLAARPVVPLSESAATEELAASHRIVVPTAGASSAVSIWKRSTLVLILLAAVGLGVAAGLGIGLYQNSRQRTSPAAAQPPASMQQETVAQPTPAARVPEPTPQPTVQAPATTVDEARQDSADTPSRDDKQVAQDVQREDEDERVPPPVVRDKPKTAPTTDARTDRRGRDEQKQDERPRRQRDDDEDIPLNMPRSIDRARQEIHRIRDIFEGRRP